jgi:hypothetical protein
LLDRPIDIGFLQATNNRYLGAEMTILSAKAKTSLVVPRRPPYPIRLADGTGQMLTFGPAPSSCSGTARNRFMAGPVNELASLIYDARERIPEANQAIGVGRGEVPTVPTERELTDGASGVEPRQHRVTGRHLPQAHRSVEAAGQNPPPVRAEQGVRHVAAVFEGREQQFARGRVPDLGGLIETGRD